MNSIFLCSEPIELNGRVLNSIEIQDSAQKHYGKEKSILYYQKIYESLDGQKRPTSDYGRDGTPFYRIASNCGLGVGVPTQSKYRDTCYKLAGACIVFFHGCSISRKKYENLPDGLKIRVE